MAARWWLRMHRDRIWAICPRWWIFIRAFWSLMPGEKGLVRYGVQEGALAAMAEKGYAAFFDVVSEPRQYVRSDQMPEEVSGETGRPV